jgi:hypothetical protein
MQHDGTSRKQGDGHDAAQIVGGNALRQARPKPCRYGLSRRDRCPNGKVDTAELRRRGPSRRECGDEGGWELTTTPAAAARPILLCIGIPVRVMKMFVRMPPPTPAKPEDTPIAAPATLGNLPPGVRSMIGRNRPGKANRAAKSRQSRAKSPVIMLPRTCGAASCAATTPVAMPGPQSRKNRKSVFPARQCANEDKLCASSSAIGHGEGGAVHSGR